MGRAGLGVAPIAVTRLSQFPHASDWPGNLREMDDKAFDTTVERLKKANAAIAKLDPAIRAEAFSLLLPYVKAGRPHGAGSGGGSDGDGVVVDPPSGRDQLLNSHGGEPVDNVLVAAAAWYMDYGSTPFTKADIQEILNSAGMTGPVRIDRTLDTTTKGQGKNLFRKQGRGKWVPSVPGEAYFRETYKVKKGTSKPEAADS